MERFVLDTNVFFNLERDTGFGTKTKDVVVNITKLATPLKAQQKAEILMPLSISEEFLGFFDPIPDYVKNFMSRTTIKAPDISTLAFPASAFYQLVSEMRERSYKGLQISEDELLKASRAFLGSETMGKKKFQQTVGPHVSKLRERYRNATRHNNLDSVQDLDLITLTKEVDGFLVSSDEGVLRWSKTFGVKQMPVEFLKDRLNFLARG